ncbi:MAG TPA: hypothetical protein VF407_20715, partial [Polyangiaceae bacterium]
FGATFFAASTALRISASFSIFVAMVRASEKCLTEVPRLALGRKIEHGSDRGISAAPAFARRDPADARA